MFLRKPFFSCAITTIQQVSLPLTTAAEERQQFFRVTVYTTNGLTSFEAKKLNDEVDVDVDVGDETAAAPALAAEAAGAEAADTSTSDPVSVAVETVGWEEMVESGGDHNKGDTWVGGPTVGFKGRAKRVVKVGVNKGSKAGVLRQAVANAVGLPPGRIALFQVRSIGLLICWFVGMLCCPSSSASSSLP